MGKIAILVHLLAASTSAGFQNCSLLTNPVAPIGKNAMGSIFRQQCGVDVSEFTNVWQKKLMIEETHNSTDPPLVLLMMGDSTMWQQYETLIMMTGAISFGGPAKTHDRPLSSTHMDYDTAVPESVLQSISSARGQEANGCASLRAVRQCTTFDDVSRFPCLIF